MESIYSLELHDDIEVCDDTLCMRVPGGWIYTIHAHVGVSAVFVPFNDEFLRSK